MSTFNKIANYFYTDKEQTIIKKKILNYIKNDSYNKLTKIPDDRLFLNNVLLKRYVEEHYVDLCKDERYAHRVEIQKCLNEFKASGMKVIPDMTKSHEYDKIYTDSIKLTEEGKKICKEIEEISNQDIADILAIYHSNYNQNTCHYNKTEIQTVDASTMTDS